MILAFAFARFHLTLTDRQTERQTDTQLEANQLSAEDISAAGAVGDDLFG